MYKKSDLNWIPITNSNQERYQDYQLKNNLHIIHKKIMVILIKNMHLTYYIYRDILSIFSSVPIRCVTLFPWAMSRSSTYYQKQLQFSVRNGVKVKVQKQHTNKRNAKWDFRYHKQLITKSFLFHFLDKQRNNWEREERYKCKRIRKSQKYKKCKRANFDKQLTSSHYHKAISKGVFVGHTTF